MSSVLELAGFRRLFISAAIVIFGVMGQAVARAWLAREQPDLVLANAAYLPLAAAARQGIPAFGMSSLNWADLFAHVFAGEPWMPPIHAQMLQAYRGARAFIKLSPGMAMPGFEVILG